MNGLRVYIRNTVAQADAGAPAFYSRKGGGPFYRWHYDEDVAMWRCSRVNSAALTAKSFDVASWKSLPNSLRTRLSEHYIE